MLAALRSFFSLFCSVLPLWFFCSCFFQFLITDKCFLSLHGVPSTRQWCCCTVQGDERTIELISALNKSEDRASWSVKPGRFSRERRIKRGYTSSHCRSLWHFLTFFFFPLSLCFLVFLWLAFPSLIAFVYPNTCNHHASLCLCCC